MRKKVTDEEFLQAYGNPHASPDMLTKEQKDNRLIIKKVTNRYSTLLSADDLHCCALHAMWRCLSYHENDRNQKFTTSLFRFVEWECRRALKKQSRKNIKTVSISDYDFAGPLTNIDSQHIRECIDLLPSKYKTLITQYFFEGRTMEEIGNIHKYSKEAARQKINKAIEKLGELYTA